jgi:hypothetical protein
MLRFFEISAFLSILTGACRVQKRERDGHTDGRGIHALRGSKHEKGALGDRAARGGVGTDLCANIPNHERPEEIAGQRDPPRIAPIVRLAIVVSDLAIKSATHEWNWRGREIRR